MLREPCKRNGIIHLKNAERKAYQCERQGKNSVAKLNQRKVFGYCCQGYFLGVTSASNPMEVASSSALE